ncbi:hypothetical protein AAZV13_08G020600 [Glycine max]|uniref:PH domain-containing protein n=3 Tax=Glycine max TaxID=3847 RepID=A0A0R0IFR9_SOYBN|nr:uncharacterized protein LOC113002366 isoform X1 [Glycine max]XP_025985269.1 uncharacterized protein LOC113002366 isoform X1 [Glycine max]KAH1235736.1 hypothetical protein GmHk_08G021140 [Glycine max]|eukprot:XP_025985268.1 uncharacterized protein LOC113002366 isoform X1 [Glycine max]
MEKDCWQTNAVMSPSDIISRTGLLYVIGRQHFPYDLLMLSQRNRLFLFNFSSLTANVADLLVLAGNLKVNVMDDGPAKLKFIPDHFQVPTSSIESPESRTSSITEPGTDQSPRSSCHQRTRRKLRRAFMLNLFTPRRLSWGSNTGGQEKVELTAAELESLRLELADIEEREAHLKAQLEHIDEVLRSARLSGYLYIRTRWATLPGEPPPLDDTEVDDWLPRFVILHGACIFLYLLCTDLSPQDSTLLSDIVEVGRLPCFKREDGEIQYAFYILTRHGLRYECSSNSKIQVDSWLSALQSDCKLESDTFCKADCKLESDTSVPNGSIEM